jgi:hypothetical protein
MFAGAAVFSVLVILMSSMSLFLLQLSKLSKPAAKALSKQQQQKTKKRSNSSTEQNTARATPVASTTSSKARSKKKTKKKLNISNVRARFFNSVLKHARRLVAAGDIVMVVHMPLSLNGKLNTLFQGLTKKQVRAILKALKKDLEWYDPRVQRKYDECAPGALMRGNCRQCSDLDNVCCACFAAAAAIASFKRM